MLRIIAVLGSIPERALFGGDVVLLDDAAQRA